MVMINEEITKEILQESKQSVSYAIRINKELTQITKELEKVFNDITNNKATKLIRQKANDKKSLLNQYKEGKLEQVKIEDENIKDFKKELEKNKVQTLITKDKETKDYIVFFKAKDTKTLEKAFIKSIQKEKKPSTLEQIKHYKDLIKAKDKEK